MLEDIRRDVAEEESSRVSVSLEAPDGVGVAIEVLAPVVGATENLSLRDATKTDKTLFPLWRRG